jgi:hypothetical protein
VLSNLGRLYDKTAGSLSLGNFLQTVKSCSGYFSAESLRARQQLPAHVDCGTLDIIELGAEIRSVTDEDPVVKKLHDLRNRRIAHRDGNMDRLATLSSLAGLSVTDTNMLVDHRSRAPVRIDGGRCVQRGPGVFLSPSCATARRSGSPTDRASLPSPYARPAGALPAVVPEMHLCRQGG